VPSDLWRCHVTRSSAW